MRFRSRWSVYAPRSVIGSPLAASYGSQLFWVHSSQASSGCMSIASWTPTGQPFRLNSSRAPGLQLSTRRNRGQHWGKVFRLHPNADKNPPAAPPASAALADSLDRLMSPNFDIE